jgi:hypothetical protein
MRSKNNEAIRRVDRVRLILELRQAYRRLAELLQQYRSASPRMRSDFFRTTRQLWVMNQALALVAIESALAHNSPAR